MDDRSSERYHRQIILQELGEAGQQKLRDARVLIAGAGGLGCPALQYLAAAGVGTIGVIDHDVVSLSNLHRQVLYTTADVGELKVSRAAARLHELNPEVQVVPYPYRLTTQNALDILGAYDMVVDATDNFPTRYLISDACVLLGKPLVHGAVSRYEGQLAVFNQPVGSAERPVSYRDLFPAPPAAGEVANCAEAGVLGVLPAIIGSMQAAEVVKMVTGIGEPLAGRIQSFNMLTNEWHTFEIPPYAGAYELIPASRDAFLHTIYDRGCPAGGIAEIDPGYFERLRIEQHVTVVDVRERGELPLLSDFRQIPLAELPASLVQLDAPILVAVCQSGRRSTIAAGLLGESFPNRTIYSLRGGIAAWQQYLQSI